MSMTDDPCVPNWQACTDSKNCCTAGWECQDDGHTPGGVCKQKVTCAPPYQTCTAELPCCDASYTCADDGHGTGTKVCKPGGPSCKALFGECTATSECCNSDAGRVTCTGGVCKPQYQCCPDGSILKDPTQTCPSGNPTWYDLSSEQCCADGSVGLKCAYSNGKTTGFSWHEFNACPDPNDAGIDPMDPNIRLYSASCVPGYHQCPGCCGDKFLYFDGQCEGTPGAQCSRGGCNCTCCGGDDPTGYICSDPYGGASCNTLPQMPVDKYAECPTRYQPNPWTILTTKQLGGRRTDGEIKSCVWAPIGPNGAGQYATREDCLHALSTA